MTWDVDVVLRYLRKLPGNHALTLQQLAHKLAMLLALSKADLAALDINLRYVQSNGVKFVITALTKTTRGGPPHEVFYSSFPEEPQLCPVRALDTYIARTDSLRSRNRQEERNPLFIAVRKPFNPATIGCWLKSVMKEAGIDTNIFTLIEEHHRQKQQRFHQQTYSKLRIGVRFYHCPFQSPSFGRGVLSIQQAPHHW